MEFKNLEVILDRLADKYEAEKLSENEVKETLFNMGLIYHKDIDLGDYFMAVFGILKNK